MIYLFIILMCTISLSLILISFILPSNFNFKKEKPSTFESGLETSTSRAMFSLRFFLVSIIFLIFDIEIILLIPVPIALTKISITENLLVLIFLILITLSLVLE